MSGAVHITLGGGNSFGIVPSPFDGDRLVFLSGDDGFHDDIGPATKKRISEIQEYLERLKIHCEE